MNNYVRQKKIGEGAFGKAWLVTSRQERSNYVIKEIATGNMSQKEREDAKKEVSVLAQMKHPNIVMYKESFEENGTLHIVMEYCDAGDLYSRINTQRGILFNEEQVLDWFVQIALALKHMHDRKILHRDIKCQNIFLTRDNRVKLGDFGIVKVLNSTTELARTCVGTPYYLSPEIVEHRPYNNKSDIWALGCVLYELTTLKHAFEAGNMKNLVLKIIRGTYPPVPPKYSYELRNLIAQMFKRNAQERPNINAILRKSFLQRRIERWLDAEHLRSEFGHTILHGHRASHQIHNPVKIPGTPSPATPVVASKRPQSAASPSPLQQQPAKIRREIPASPVLVGAVRGPSPSPIAGLNYDGASERQRFLAQRREEMERKLRQKREQPMIEKQKELGDKQRMQVINEAREAGWRNILSPSNNESSGDGSSQGKAENREDIPSPFVERHAPPRIAPVPLDSPILGDNRAAGRYAHYHEQLDVLREQQRDPIGVAARLGGGGAYHQFNKARYMEDPGAAMIALEKGIRNAAQGQDASKQAQVVEDFLQARYIAARNKARESEGVAAVLGAARPYSGSNEKNKQEEEYLKRLEQIRQRNYIDRRNLFPNLRVQREEAANQLEDISHRREALERLKKQSEDNRRLLQAHLEAKRKQEANRQNLSPRGLGAAYEERQSGDDRYNAALPKRGVSPGIVAASRSPAPPSITAVMQKLEAASVIVQEVPSPCHVSPPSITAVMQKLEAPSPSQMSPPSITAILQKMEAPSPSQMSPPSITAILQKMEGGGSIMSVPNDSASSAHNRNSQPTPSITVVLEKLAVNQHPIPPINHSMNEPTTVASREKRNESSTDPNSLEHSVLQKKKEGILKRLNANKLLEDRNRWDSSNAVNNSNESAPSLSDYPLESTASQMEITVKSTELPTKEQTNVEDKIISGSVMNGKRSLDNNLGTSGDESTRKGPIKCWDQHFGTTVTLSSVDPALDGHLSTIAEVTTEINESRHMKHSSPSDNFVSDSTTHEHSKKDGFLIFHKPSSDIKMIAKHVSGMMGEGLTTGKFDLSDTGLLRTCSLPDLNECEVIEEVSSDESQVLSENDKSKSTYHATMEKNTHSDPGALNDDQPQYTTTQRKVSYLHNRSIEKEQTTTSSGNENSIEKPLFINDAWSKDREVLPPVPEICPVKKSPIHHASLIVQSAASAIVLESTTVTSVCENSSQNTENERTSLKDNDDTLTQDELTEMEEDLEDLESIRQSMLALLNGADLDDEDDEEENSEGNEIDKSGTISPDNVLQTSGYSDRGESNISPNDEWEKDETNGSDQQFDFEDESEDFGDDSLEQTDSVKNDIFQRLEKARAALEAELGIDLLMRAYETIQALQEDEDESVNESEEKVRNMLGDKASCYDRILQLVLADGIFMEDD